MTRVVKLRLTMMLLIAGILVTACGQPSPASGVSRSGPTPTETRCAWIENPGPPPPEVEQRAQQVFAATGISGTLKLRGAGEWYCAEFHLRSIDFEFTLLVKDLRDQAALKALAAQVQGIPAQSSNKSSNIRLRFKSGNQFCWWNADKGCGEIMTE